MTQRKLLSLLIAHTGKIQAATAVHLRSNYSYCWRLKDSLCQFEWEEVRRLGVKLPDCDSLPLQTPQCQGNTIILHNESRTSGKNLLYDAAVLQDVK